MKNISMHGPVRRGWSFGAVFAFIWPVGMWSFAKKINSVDWNGFFSILSMRVRKNIY